MSQLKPQDLRYGNLIEAQGKIFKVTAIEKHIVTADRGKGNVDFTYAEINPIPLTEDILLKAGFERGLIFKKYVTNEFNINIITPYKDQKEFYFMPAGNIKWGVYLNSVNELQNLVKSLTGEELEVNLK